MVPEPLYETHRAMPTLTIRYSGMFDFDGLFTMIARWFKEKKFWYEEHTYKHTLAAPFAEEEIGMTGEREVTTFVKFTIDVTMKLWNMKETTAVFKGEKKKLLTGRIEIKINGAVDIDYQKWFEKSKFWRIVADFYYRYIIKKTIEEKWEDDLFNLMSNLHSKIKNFLEMGAR
ncbi:hypothetical protein DRJ19_01415 [Candidatus Woesearchaeota archaeon]|nr:MAG: hypothetical protein DRJ19_01415 [Candidatus Woesearchaeota archaeon]